MVSLSLPSLSPAYEIIRVTCRAEPNPPGHQRTAQSSADSQPAFYPSGMHAVAIFNITVGFRIFSFIAHRHVLLSLIPQSLSDDEDEVPRVLWRDWEPSSTRWFQTEVLASYWITTTTGQRWVYTLKDTPSFPMSYIHVVDFNPYLVKRLGPNFEHESALSRSKVVTGSELLKADGVFDEDVWSTLPYFECESKAMFDYAAVLMDEEHVVGIQVGTPTFTMLHPCTYVFSGSSMTNSMIL